MTAQDRKRAAQSLRSLRLRRGWSLQDEARALRDAARRLGMPAVARSDLRVIQRNVARWENENVRPGDRYQLLLAHIYAQHDHTTALGPGSDFDHLMTVFALYGVGILVEGIGKELPIVALPFTNQAHAAHPAFAENIDKLRSWGAKVLFGPEVYPLHAPGTGSDYLHLYPWSMALDELETSSKKSRK